MALSKLTNTLRKIIEDIDTRTYDVPIESDKWRNLYVSKNEGSKLGDFIFNSENEALLSYRKSCPLGTHWVWHSGKNVKMSETVCFQIPWKEPRHV